MVMPIAGGLMKKGVRPQRLLAFGLFIMAASLWLMSGLNLAADFSSIAWPRMIQGLGLGLFFVPLSASAYVNIPRQEMGNASGVFNLIRNLGGSFGVAVSTTLLSQRSQLHQNFLVENVTPFSLTLRQYAEEFARIFPGQGDPESTSTLAGIYRELIRQAHMLAFNDIFWLFCWFTAALIPLTLIMRSRRSSPAPVQSTGP
jgi:DHA2 family multidrug resistance protein